MTTLYILIIFYSVYYRLSFCIRYVQDYFFQTYVYNYYLSLFIYVYVCVAYVDISSLQNKLLPLIYPDDIWEKREFVEIESPEDMARRNKAVGYTGFSFNIVFFP